MADVRRRHQERGGELVRLSFTVALAGVGVSVHDEMTKLVRRIES